jgi:hypothetical protein
MTNFMFSCNSLTEAEADGGLLICFLFKVLQLCLRTEQLTKLGYIYNLDTLTMSGGVFIRREPENQQRCSQGPPERAASQLPRLPSGN